MQRTIIISRQFTFEAAHSVTLPDGTSEGYKRLHGHSFVATLSIRGKKTEIDNWIMDFGSLDPVIDKVKDKLDHAYLNELPGLGVPTMENMCAYIFDLVKADVPGLSAVELSRPTCGQTCKLELEG